MQIIETRNKASPPFPDPAQDQLEKLLQVYLVKKPVNFGPHFLVNESETR